MKVMICRFTVLAGLIDLKYIAFGSQCLVIQMFMQRGPTSSHLPTGHIETVWLARDPSTPPSPPTRPKNYGNHNVYNDFEVGQGPAEDSPPQDTMEIKMFQ